jgi:hypothetical protein
MVFEEDEWPESNPLSGEHAIAFLMAIGVIVEPRVFTEGPEMLRGSVEDDAFEAVLTACTITACASRLLPRRDRHRDHDEAVVEASGLPRSPAGTDLTRELLYLIAKLNAGVDADPQPLLDEAASSDVVEIAVAVTVGYLRVYAETTHIPVQKYAAALFNEVFELKA